MRPQRNSEYIAFSGTRKLAAGSAVEVAAQAKRHLTDHPDATLLIFDRRTSAQIEFDLRGTEAAVLKRLEKSFAEEEEDPVKPAGPGRPKLGVVSREVSLLPRQWEWLAAQPGGASATIRRLVDDAKKRTADLDRVREAQEAAYKFMNVMAGNLPHYEEALRALYSGKADLFVTLTANWPEDVREHAWRLAAAALESGPSGSGA